MKRVAIFADVQFGNCLVDEYSALATDLGFSKSDIVRLILNAIDAAWLPRDKKMNWLRSYPRRPISR